MTSKQATLTADSSFSGKRINVTYRLRCGLEEAEPFARRIAYEQTVELPEALITSPEILEQVVGRVERVIPDETDSEYHMAVISYAEHLASAQLPQLINLIYGNASMFPGVRVIDLDIPETLLDHFQGPAHGIEGLRRILGVWDRPLLSTALKPRGASLEDLTAMAYGFAAGGGDIVKDDQNLVGDFDSFKRRVSGCQQTVARANEKFDGRCLYFPHIAAPAGDLERYFEFAYKQGIRGVLLCPMVMGMDTARSLARRYNLVHMAHPALSGAYTSPANQGIAHDILLGTLFRLAGADISVFPHVGGRFSYTDKACRAVRARLLEPLGGLASSWPCPAGGMHYEQIGELCKTYGPDAVFLIGGSLLGHSHDIAASTRSFMARIEDHFDARRSTPETRPPSSCEIPGSGINTDTLRHLVFQDGFEWRGRTSTAYKTSEEIAFKGVRRVELIGKQGEQTRFELRYFEIEPGGYSSREKHRHTHVVIAARGRGILATDAGRDPLKPMDIAYVQPLEAHQFLNEASEPFGFFCLVDRHRDRPMPP